MASNNTEVLHAFADLLECMLGISKQKALRVGNALVVIATWLWDRSSDILGAGRSMLQGVCAALQHATAWLYEKMSVFKCYATSRRRPAPLSAEAIMVSTLTMPAHATDATGVTLFERTDRTVSAGGAMDIMDITM